MSNPEEPMAQDKGSSASPARRKRASVRMLVRAVVLAGLFAVAHLLGWRSHVWVLAGTGSFDTVHAIFGITYVGLYLLAVVMAPIFIIAAVILAAMDWLSPSR